MDIKRQVKTFKWKEVMAFMKANPAILNQYLQINEVSDSYLDERLESFNVGPGSGNRPDLNNNMKPRYTQKVLESI